MAMTGGTAYLVKSEKTNYGSNSWTTDLYIYVKVISQNVIANSSTIALGMYVYSQYSIAWSDFGTNGTSYIGTATSGSNCFTFTNGQSGSGTKWLIEDKQVTVSHNSNGTLTLPIYWHWGVNSPWGQYTGPSGSYNVTLSTIDRAAPKDTWEAAQRILEERSRNHCRTRIAHSFTGMIECGCCGKNYLHKVNNSQCKWQTDIWACRTYLRDGKKACGNSRIKDTVLKEKFISAYNEFIERRPQGDSMVALQEVLEDLRQQEQELAELMMQRLITKAAYEEERKSVKMQIADISEKISERRAKRVPESEYVPITEFSEEKAKRFLSKVVVTMFTVTFVFYNGAKIMRTYDNGQPGNKVGWNKKKEES